MAVFCNSATAQEKVNVQIKPNIDCDQDLYCIDLNVSLDEGEADLLGGSSIWVSYDPTAILFQGHSNDGSYDDVFQGSYIPKNFYDQSTCGIFKPYSAHSFDGDIPGNFLLTLHLYGEVPIEDCSSLISEEPSTVATICFVLLDPDKSPNLQILGTENGVVTDSSATNFNTKTYDKYLNGTFTNLYQDFNSLCSDKGSDGYTTLGNDLVIASIWPIPVRDQLMVNVRAESSEDIEVNIFDLNGKLLARNSERIHKGLNQMSYEVNNLAAGAYLLSIKKGDEMLNHKFIKD